MVEIGKEAEDFIGEVASESCIVDFVFVRPSWQKSGKNRELCDLLIELDGECLCFEIKAQNVLGNPSQEKEARWIIKRLKRGIGQVKGALRALTLKGSTVQGVNLRRGVVKFSAGNLTPTHGVVLLDIRSQYFNIPEDAPRRNANNVPIHYFTFGDFMGLVKKLGTLPDLMNYLSARASIPAWSTPVLGKERDVYAYYLTHRCKFSTSISPNDLDGEWHRLTELNKTFYEEKLEEDRYAEIVNHMIKDVHDIDPKQDHYTPEELLGSIGSLEDRKKYYIKIATELNRLPRINRREIGKKLIEKIDLATKESIPRYFAIMSPGSSCVYFFLVAQSERMERVRMLHNLLCAAMATTQNQKGLGVAVNDMNQQGHSFDFILIEGIDLNDPRLLEMARKLLVAPKMFRVHDFPVEDRMIVLPEDMKAED